jgi:hypothetical protein
MCGNLSESLLQSKEILGCEEKRNDVVESMHYQKKLELQNAIAYFVCILLKYQEK